MLTADQVEAVLQVGHETASFEFKGPGSSDDSYFFAKIVRAALSLGNLRDGGYVFIGVADDDPTALGPGLEDEQLASWENYDAIASRLAVYADPPVSFETGRATLSSGATVAVIQVHEFADVPHLCAKAYDPTLRAGALYVRTRRVPETAEVAGSVEMRDVLDLAVEKGVRTFLQTASRAGLATRAAGESGTYHRERFEQERDQGWR